MGESNVYLALNLVAYSLLAYWIFKKFKGLSGTFVVFSYYALAALATILFYNLPLTQETDFYRDIVPGSLIYFFILTVIISNPLTVFDKKVSLKKVYVVDEKLILVLLKFFLAIQLILYVSFTPYFLSVWNAPDLEEIRGELFTGESGISNAVPGIVLKIFVYYNWMRNVAVVIAIYAFLFIKRQRKIVIVATVSTLFYPMFYSMLLVMRSQIFLQLITILFFVIIFRKYISKKTMKGLMIIGCIFLFFVVASMILISNGRFGDSAEWMYYKYLGETYINVSNLWQDQYGYTEGMAYFRKILTGQDFQTTRDKWAFIYSETGVDGHVFNASIGQLMIEFGAVVTAIIYLVISIASRAFLKSQRGVSLSGMLLVGLLSQFLFYGFYVFPFQGTAIIELFLFIIAIVFFNSRQRLLKEKPV